MCPICKIGIPAYMELNAQMDPKARAYFDVYATFEMMVHLQSVRTFQKRQFDNLVNGINVMSAKYDRALEVKREKEAELARIDEKYNKAKQYRRQLQDQYKQLVEMERTRNNSSGYSSMDHSQSLQLNTSVSMSRRYSVQKDAHKLSF